MPQEDSDSSEVAEIHILDLLSASSESSDSSEMTAPENCLAFVSHDPNRSCRSPVSIASLLANCASLVLCGHAAENVYACGEGHEMAACKESREMALLGLVLTLLAQVFHIGETVFFCRAKRLSTRPLVYLFISYISFALLAIAGMVAVPGSKSVSLESMITPLTLHFLTAFLGSCTAIYTNT